MKPIIMAEASKDVTKNTELISKNQMVELAMAAIIVAFFLGVGVGMKIDPEHVLKIN